MLQQSCSARDEFTSIIAGLEVNLVRLQNLSFWGCDDAQVHRAREQDIKALENTIADLTTELNIHEQACEECRG
jgi:hypothetical protein